MTKDIQTEAIGAWAQKDNLEKALIAGMGGAIEFKHDEKIYYLGEFKEKVLCLLSKGQVAETAIYPEIVRALEDKRGTKMIIDGSIRISVVEKYKKLAKKANKPYILRSDPEFKGSTGLMVISDDAVEDEQVITVQDRKDRLKNLGMSSALIDAVGKKMCKECLGKILEIDPQEAPNYKELNFLDRIYGERCPAHEE